MPRKTSNWDMDLIKAGVADFTVEDRKISKHALARARERKIKLESLWKADTEGVGVTIGKTVVTAVRPERRPVTLRLSPGMKVDSSLFADPDLLERRNERERKRREDLDCLIATAEDRVECGNCAGLIIGRGGSNIKGLKARFAVLAEMAPGSDILLLKRTSHTKSDVHGAASEVRKLLAKHEKRTRAVAELMASADERIDCGCYAGLIVGKFGANLNRIRMNFRVKAEMLRGTNVLLLKRSPSNADSNVEGAASEVRRILASHSAKSAKDRRK